MDNETQLREMLIRAGEEIRRNRETIARLSAKCEVIDMLSAMMNLHRASSGYSMDILWEIQKTLEETAPKVAP